MATYKLEVKKGAVVFREAEVDSSTGVLEVQTRPVTIPTAEIKDFLHMLDSLLSYSITHGVQSIEFTEQ